MNPPSPTVVVPLHGEAHRAMQALLPWYASGTLDGDDRAAVAAHLEACARCQADLAFERRLLAAHAALEASEDGAEAAELGLARLHARMQAPHGARLAAQWQGWKGWWRGRLLQPSASALRMGLALQFGVIVLLAAGLLANPVAERYRALGAPSSTLADGATLLVMFRADATEAQLRAAVQAAGARIADGPTAAGAYVLALPSAQSAQALRALRAEPIVTLAEPLAAGAER